MIARGGYLKSASLAVAALVLALLVLVMTLTGCTSQDSEKRAAESSSATEATSADGETSSVQDEQSAAEGETMGKFQIDVGGTTFEGTFASTEAAAELERRLPLTLNMSDLSGNEKYYKTGQNFPGSDESPSELHAGEIWIYSGDYVVLFYEDHANPGYRYQFVGSLDDPAGLAEAVGSGGIQVTIRQA